MTFNYPSENVGLNQPIPQNSYPFELCFSRPKYRSHSKMNSVALREPTPSSIDSLYNSWVKKKKSRLYIQRIRTYIWLPQLLFIAFPVHIVLQNVTTSRPHIWTLPSFFLPNPSQVSRVNVCSRPSKWKVSKPPNFTPFPVSSRRNPISWRVISFFFWLILCWLLFLFGNFL